MGFKVLSAVLGVGVLLGACGERQEERAEERFSGSVHPELQAHTAEFRREVIKVTDGVFVAVGFGLANSILIEGDDGVIIVDTMESRSEAEAVKAAFAEITDKPIRGVILTHNHTDHIYGGSVFTGNDPSVEVWAHASTEYYIDRIVSMISSAISLRSMRMFGQFLTDAEVENAGIGPKLAFKTEEMALARPTHTFEESTDIEIAGVKLTLVHAPGETPDQLFVWLPEKRVLLPGDNFYRAFPNLYTIRGTAYRDVLDWVEALDKMRSHRPAYLVPSHTRPLEGEDYIYEHLTAYRDAIQFVHDQTIRTMNKGMTPDQAVGFVKLPPHLAENEFLRPFYGTVEWSVRSIFDGYLGWFGGDAVTLEPMDPDMRATRFAAAVSSELSLEEQAQAALVEGDLKWALELSDVLVRTEPDSKSAKTLKAQALRALGEAHISANGRHYYIAQSGEALGEEIPTRTDRSAIPEDFVAGLPMANLMTSMPSKLKAELTLEKDEVVVFQFTDSGAAYSFHIRRGVAELTLGAAEDPDVLISTTEETWKDIVFGRRSPAMAFATGDIDVDGGVVRVAKFLNLFERT